MHRLSVLLMAILILVAISCSSGGISPTVPSTNPGITGSINNTGQTQTHLWGYYDVIIDIENQTVEVVFNRSVMFAANVVNFLNNSPGSLGFVINDTPTGLDYTDVDIDVSLTHPFSGMPQYHGYDVRGVFMGDGSATMAYNGDLIYPVFGTDQFMFPDPDGGNGAPDGYTRWFNLPEFGSASMPLFGYTQGNMAAPDFAGTATLCPYKYFADGLDTHDNLWTWLNDNADQHGQFSSGATNTRNYYLRFPDDKGIMYGYAVIANWEADDVHPSNAPEAVTCTVVDNSDVYYVDATTNGGSLKLDINVFGWDFQPSTINIESTVLGAVSNFDASTIVTGGGDNYSTYHVEIPADDIEGTDGNEFWVIAEYGAFDYTNDFGILNDAWEDALAAFFRFDLYVSPEEPGTGVPEFIFAAHAYYDGVSPLGTSDDPVPTEWIVDFDASTSTDTTTYDWDFDGDGTYEFTGDTTPYRSYAYPYDPAETYPVTYQVTLRVSGGATIPHPIVIARGVYVDDATGSSGGTGEIADPFDTINHGIGGAIPSGGSIVMVRGDNGSGGQQIYNERIDLTSSHAGIGLQGYSLNDGNSLPPAMRNYTPAYRAVGSNWYSECIYVLGADGVRVDGFEFENIRGVDDPSSTHWHEKVNVIIFVDSDNVRVSHIYCHHIWTTSSIQGWKPGYNIRLDNCDNAVVTNNLMCDGLCAADWGTVDWLYVTNSDGLLAANNTVDQINDGPWTTAWWVAYVHGVQLHSTNSAQVVNTLITNLTGIRSGVPQGGGWGFRGSGNTNPVADYCNVWNIRMAYWPVGTNYSFDHRFDGDITEGANCINPGPANGDYGSDPLYVSGVNDHHLDTGSPCIDTGDPAIQDFDGSPSDMGCYGGPGGDWNFEN